MERTCKTSEMPSHIQVQIKWIYVKAQTELQSAKDTCQHYKNKTLYHRKEKHNPEQGPEEFISVHPFCRSQFTQVHPRTPSKPQ